MEDQQQKKITMQEELTGQIKLDPVQPLELLYDRISVEAKIQIQVPDQKGGYKKQPTSRFILKECSGKFDPKTMTAILGPSGCGKTTMLNLLSGRLLSKNLTLRGVVKINNMAIKSMSEHNSLIGYVMQEDILLPTFTPAQTFRFITDMRLPHKTSQEKDGLVSDMIQSLGLKKCRDTYVGNSLIRGISGGQRKRTSVGVQLLINPSLIFLDQPTTGLDSTTALNLIRFLNRLAEAGRTIVTTIHQPSSQIFREFDRVMLMVDGSIIYNNNASSSMKYFEKLGMPVPPHSNPIDHYMKLMNKEGIALQYIERGEEYEEQSIEKEFNQKMSVLVKSYKSETKAPQSQCNVELRQINTQASWCTQFWLIVGRTIKNQLRNPLGVRSKLGQSIFFAVFAIILFEKESQDLNSYIQNTKGAIFFIVMNIAFSAIFGSINIFSQQRSVFIRERLSNTYGVSSYYVGRSFANLPLEILLPIIMLVIQYFAIHLDNDADSFFATAGSCWLAYWMASAYGLVLSTAFSNPEMALTLVPILIVPLMLIGGFFAPLQDVPQFYRIFEYISVFKYNYQSSIQAQFMDDRDGFSYKGESYNGDILSKGQLLYFEEPMWLSLLLMGLIGLALRVLALIILYVISNPKKLQLQDPLPNEEGNFITAQKNASNVQMVNPAKK